MDERQRGAVILLAWVIFAAIGAVASVAFIVNHIF